MSGSSASIVTSGGPSALALDGVTVRYGYRRALDDVSLSIEPGRLCAVCGGNGAGKTTLCRVIAGYLDADAGAIRIGGVARVPGAVAEPAVTFLPEHAPLPAELSVAEYLLHRAALRGLPRRGRRAAVAEALARVAIADRRGDAIGRLSKGLRQRVALGAALLGAPRLLILDEPAAGLDEAQRAELCRLLRELSGERTIVWATHELGDVDATADQVVVLAGGRVVADGEPRAIRAAAAIPAEAPLREAVIELGARA